MEEAWLTEKNWARASRRSIRSETMPWRLTWPCWKQQAVLICKGVMNEQGERVLIAALSNEPMPETPYQGINLQASVPITCDKGRGAEQTSNVTCRPEDSLSSDLTPRKAAPQKY